MAAEKDHLDGWRAACAAWWNAHPGCRAARGAAAAVEAPFVNRGPDPEAAALPRGYVRSEGRGHGRRGRPPGPRQRPPWAPRSQTAQSRGRRRRAAPPDHDRSAPQDPFAPRSGRAGRSVPWGDRTGGRPSDVVPTGSSAGPHAVLAREAASPGCRGPPGCGVRRTAHGAGQRILAEDPVAARPGDIPRRARDSQLPRVTVRRPARR
ncbi:hypothetical protein QJS66_06090 [Kocuria rhizophila]|nr:hypothetical protein QJS66_06090 [Kocuria rhizophila]